MWFTISSLNYVICNVKKHKKRNKITQHAFIHTFLSREIEHWKPMKQISHKLPEKMLPIEHAAFKKKGSDPNNAPKVKKCPTKKKHFYSAFNIFLVTDS